MALFVKIFRKGERAGNKASQQDGSDKLTEGLELLLRMEENLRNKIDQELLLAKKECTTNRRVALQALRRKKWYENHLKCIACAVKAVQATSKQIDIVNKVNDLIKDITENPDVTQDRLRTFYTSEGFDVQFDEDNLLADLKRLEENLDESPFEEKTREEKKEVLCFQMLSSASPAHTEKTEEDEVEDDLKYLWRWANEIS